MIRKPKVKMIKKIIYPRIINRLTDGIAEAENDEPDHYCWGSQQGVLISRNDAEILLSIVKKKYEKIRIKETKLKPTDEIKSRKRKTGQSN